jgi:glycerophosphoryl diester phosphodiesterase
MAQFSTFDLQGHRGCRGLRPENTLPAFFHALDIGVNTLELDVVITKDKQVIVSHEAYFNPLITTLYPISYQSIWNTMNHHINSLVCCINNFIS